MFSVIISTNVLSPLVFNTVICLIPHKQVKQIIIVNNSKKELSTKTRVPGLHIINKFGVHHEALNHSINFANQSNIVLLDGNIQVGSTFISKLIKSYNTNNIYTFMINAITKDDIVILDKKNYKEASWKDFDSYAMAFEKRIFIEIGGFDSDDPCDFAKKADKSNFSLKIIKNITVHKRVDTYIPSYNKESKEESNVSNKDIAVVYTQPDGVLETNIHLSDKIKYSFIFPFMYNGDRWPLFQATIDNLYSIIEKKDNCEIIVHETSPKRFITDEFINKYNIQYIFNEFDDLFHRAWNLNVSARYIANGSILIFMDGDVIIEKDWFTKLTRIHKNKCYIGWKTIKNLSKEATNIYLTENKIVKPFIRTRTFISPETGAAAGINIIPKDIFKKLQGWPEDYGGFGYGGEDNSLYLKMKAFGYKYELLDSTIYHLYHEHKTNSVKNSKNIPIPQKIVRQHKLMKKSDWESYLKKDKNMNWGYCRKLDELQKSLNY